MRKVEGLRRYAEKAGDAIDIGCWKNWGENMEGLEWREVGLWKLDEFGELELRKLGEFTLFLCGDYTMWYR